MKIAILDDYQNVVKDLKCFELLRHHEVRVLTETFHDEDRLAEQLAGIEALVLIRERTQITESLLAKLPELKVISQTGKVSNHIDPRLCEQYGVKVLEGVGSPVAPSELCWALIMSASRHIPVYVSSLQQGEWQQSGELGLGRTLNGLTLGIWGYGKIGQRIAQYAKVFGMQVLVWGSEASRVNATRDGFAAASSKAQFFRTADIVSLHLRLNEVTRGCVTQADLALMKPDSLFVNTSRAELVEPQALYDELSKHPTKRAALDVFENEPATIESEPLLSLPNVLATPHLGYVEHHSYALYFRVAFENLLDYMQAQSAQ
ncbi:D-2-hydroxyacid dehydrogenase family protein [Photobacterium sp. MCCC 1A19761]|uniref:D-2-hydroxyacid dehydrogenase family protein n=1 Tax=Photobacterium sp. MCCC 1A19761 TaxID=3115000 RepID=UPI00307DC3CC